MHILILGNGQLGQMLGQAAITTGHACLLVNTRTQEVAPVGAWEPLGISLSDAMSWADIVTWEHENLDPEHVAMAGSKLLTRADHILPLTHRQQEKQLCDELGIATAPWQSFQDPGGLEQALTDRANAAVIKAASGGYDGKNQWRWQPGQEITTLSQTAGRQPGIIEQLIPFSHEVSLVGARARDGRISCYPLVHNVHRQGILSHTLAHYATEPDSLQETAEQAFRKLTEKLGYVGTLAIEFFVVPQATGPQLLLNEVAPRVHNSGHWSLSGANVSQFDLHIRALTGMPFPALQVRPTLMVNVIGVGRIPDTYWQDPDADPFWYGKEPRPGRKVGHINFRLTAPDTAHRYASQCPKQLQHLAEG